MKRISIYKEFVDFALRDRRFLNYSEAWQKENQKLREIEKKRPEGGVDNYSIFLEREWREEYDAALKGRTRYDRELRGLIPTLWQDFLLQKTFKILEVSMKNVRGRTEKTPEADADRSQ